MPAERFLDTNILLYGYDLDAPEKRQIAQSLIEQAWLQPGRTAISVQVPGIPRQFRPQRPSRRRGRRTHRGFFPLAGHR
jgi:hypothetical protein